GPGGDTATSAGPGSSSAAPERSSASSAWVPTLAAMPTATPAVPGVDRPAARACAASRRAQSWNVGHTGNALERQYASWWASARGAGVTSAKQRWRWSGLDDRSSRSSSNAMKGQAGGPSPVIPRSLIVPMVHVEPVEPAGLRYRPRGGGCDRRRARADELHLDPRPRGARLRGPRRRHPGGRLRDG